MFNLVLKDLLIQKKSFIVCILYAVLFPIVFQHTNTPSMIFIAVPSCISYLLLMYACAYDDKNKSDMLLNSLPINRMDIIIAKYLSVFVFILIGLAASFIFNSILTLLGLIHLPRFMNFEDILGCAISIILLSSLYLPLFFKLGYLKSRYINTVLFMCAFFVPSLLIESVSKGSFSKFVVYLNSQPNWLVSTFMLIILLIMMLVSLLLSSKFYLNKDL